MQGLSKLRIARPTMQIAVPLPFYRDGLGLQVHGSFKNHDGFDGIMLGHPVTINRMQANNIYPVKSYN